MISRWLLVYTFEPALPVRTRIDAYPELGLTFTHENGNLAGVEHRVETSIDAYSYEVADESEESLGVLWQALEFEYGLPVRWVCRVTSIPEPEDCPPDGGEFSSVTLTARADGFVAAPVQVPRATTLQAPDPRLRQWLALANGARLATDPGDALASYYVILEDVFGKRPASGDVLNFKHVRDFVSHPEIRNPDAVAFVRAALGVGVTRYEPHNSRHREFVASWRDRARAVAEAEIRKLL